MWFHDQTTLRNLQPIRARSAALLALGGELLAQGQNFVVGVAEFHELLAQGGDQLIAFHQCLAPRLIADSMLVAHFASNAASMRASRSALMPFG